MTSDKVIVRLNVPKIGKEYDVILPINQQIYIITKILMKAVQEFTSGYYQPQEVPRLFNKLNARELDINKTLKEVNIGNGGEIIMI